MISNGELTFFILSVVTIITLTLKSVSPDKLKKIIYSLIMINSIAIVVIVFLLTGK